MEGRVCGPTDAHKSGLVWLKNQFLAGNGAKWLDFQVDVRSTGLTAIDAVIDKDGNVFPNWMRPIETLILSLNRLTEIEETGVLIHDIIALLVVRPHEPNDKIGPTGTGPNRVVSADDVMEYLIRTENSATASAPVQELILVDYLDGNLDWTTVELRERLPTVIVSSPFRLPASLTLGATILQRVRLVSSGRMQPAWR